MFFVAIMFFFFIVYIIFSEYRCKKIHNECNYHEIIEILLRQCARWALTSIQDTTPLVRLLHANYSTGYLWALKDIATDDEIENATGVDMKKFTLRILRIQDETTANVIKVCPNFGPQEKYLFGVANLFQ